MSDLPSAGNIVYAPPVPTPSPNPSQGETVKQFMIRLIGWNWNEFEAVRAANNGKGTDVTNLLVLAEAGSAEIRKIGGDDILVPTDRD